MKAGLLLLLAGCLGPAESIRKVGGHVLVDTNGDVGADATWIGGRHGLQVGAAVYGRQLTRAGDPNRYLGFGADVLVRGSFVGLFINPDDHSLEHWFDFGGEVGAGGGGAYPTHFMAEGHGYGGAWLDIGLWTGDAYPALELAVRREAEGSPWNDQTLFSIGVSWVHRERVGAFTLRD